MDIECAVMEIAPFRFKPLRLLGARLCAVLFGCAVGVLGGCRSVRDHRAATERAAADAVTAAQEAALGRSEPVVVETAADTLRRRLLLEQDLPHADESSFGVRDIPASPHWAPDRHVAATGGVSCLDLPAGALILDLSLALQVAARNSREYQVAKETLFRQALQLDLVRDDYRHTFSGALAARADRAGGGDAGVETVQASGEVGFSRQLLSGVSYSAGLAVDLVKLLTQDAASSIGLLADASIAVPLMRGAGGLVAGEPLVQAERDMIDEVLVFERFKTLFAVRIASAYFGALREQQQVVNAVQSYRRLVQASERTRRLADAGRLPEIQYDQTVQSELRARTRWISAEQSHADGMDTFRAQLGLPPDAAVTLDGAELARLNSQVGEVLPDGASATPAAEATALAAPEAPGMLAAAGRRGDDVDSEAAVRVALEWRLDMRRARRRVEDATRHVTVAADALRAEVTLLGSARVGDRRTDAGGAGLPDARLKPREGSYGGLLTIDLPFERTAEAVAYRASLIDLEGAVRDLQDLEDGIKIEVRGDLRELARTREEVGIQRKAVALAEKRVASTDLFLQAGRAQVRDVLEAQESLVTAQNALTAAVVSYRLAELALQRDLGRLEVTADGLWREEKIEEIVK